MYSLFGMGVSRAGDVLKKYRGHGEDSFIGRSEMKANGKDKPAPPTPQA